MTDNNKVSPLGCLFTIIWLPLLITATSIYRGFVLTKLWAWFAVPTFGLPGLGIAAAIGLSIIVGYLTTSTGAADDEANKNKSLGEVVLAATVKAMLLPSLSWLMGYVVSRYM